MGKGSLHRMDQMPIHVAFEHLSQRLLMTEKVTLLLVLASWHNFWVKLVTHMDKEDEEGEKDEEEEEKDNWHKI